MEGHSDGRQHHQVQQDPEHEGDDADKKEEGDHGLAGDDSPLLHLVAQCSPALRSEMGFLLGTLKGKGENVKQFGKEF